MMTNDEVTARLRQLSDLPSNWDGDDAEAPTAAAINAATSIARAASRLPDEIDADAAGGVALPYHQERDQVVACYCRNWDTIAIVTYDHGQWVSQVTTRLGARTAIMFLADALRDTDDKRAVDSAPLR
jgi:hypothetical protein